MNATRDILLQATQPHECASFYERHFAFRPFMRDARMIGLDAGALRLFIDEGPSYGPVLEFLVRDISDAKQRLLDDGCVIDQDQPQVPRCYVRDPFGLIFNIRQSAPKLP